MKTRLTLAVATALVLAGGTPAGAQEVTLRAVNAFAKGTTFARPFERFVERVNAEGKGLVQIRYIGGPEAIPPFEVGTSLQAGIIDIANVTSAYYPNLLPEGDALHLATNTIQDQRANGCWEKINRLHNEKMNAYFLARTGDHIPYHLYLTKPIDGPDLSGLTIRTTPAYRAFFTKLGANLVQTAPGEVYTALERGAIDGYGWPLQGVLDLGWHEQTRYRVDPGFYQVDVNVLVNLDTWNSLTDAQRDFLTQKALELEAENAQNIEINAEERARQAEAGIQTITLEGADAETWVETAQDEGWAVVERINAQVAAELRPCLTAAAR